MIDKFRHEQRRGNRHPDVPKTLAELASIVRALRKAQNYAYYEPDRKQKYHLEGVALRLGREVDYCLRMMEINDKIQEKSISK
jgi:hypothetical protein